MKVKFVLTMEQAVVGAKCFDEIVIDWTTEINQEDMQKFSYEWITSNNFLMSRMPDLESVGESSLTIEPLE
ncbi:MAG: hypothetical protein AAB515_04130 [Patescibacteria group bacterium]